MKEYILSDKGQIIEVPADFFGDCRGRDYVIACRDGDNWTVSEAGGMAESSLKTGEYKEIDSGRGGLMTLVIRPFCFRFFSFFRLAPVISVGRGSDQDVCISFSQSVSRKHMMICRQEEEWIVRCFSPNGLYINGLCCGEVHKLQYGDDLEISGFHMLFLGNLLACQDHPQVRIRLSKEKKEEGEESGGMKICPCRSGWDSDYYHRSPRDFLVRQPEAAVIERPPDIHSPPGESWVHVAGPMFTMMIPMISGSLFMLYAARSSGEDLALSLYSGLFMALVSGVCSILWSVISRIMSRRDRRREAEEMTRQYQDYLCRMNRRISDAYEDYRLALLERAPAGSQLALLTEESSGLWNRNPRHRDFLLCRIGIGSLPFPSPPKLPAEEFKNYGRDLWMELESMSEKFRTLYKVPILADLRKNRLIGYSGEKADDRMAFLRSLTVQIAAVHCYTEVKLVYIYNRRKIFSGEGVESLRWLPHVYHSRGRERFLASDREEARNILRYLEKIFRDREEAAGRDSRPGSQPHFVVFILEPEYLEGEWFMRFFEDRRTKDSSGEFRSCDLGLTGVWIVPERDGLPNCCTTILEQNEVFQGMDLLEAGPECTCEISFDNIPTGLFDRFARRISGVRVAEMEVSREIPDMVSFFQLFNVDTVQELSISDRWKRNRAYEGLRAEIGFQAGSRPCILDISEKSHGPHGLVAGTTGSGKSEMLQTFLLSLAVNYSPEDVNFFLIDYKGGGMADLFEGFPHLCGSISNLSGGLIRRAMVSVKSENRRRQKLFRQYKVNNIRDYQILYYQGEINEVLPHLVIVIDEFAELKKEEPDFMQELISVAQVGRSLGVHLILATQKPGGTVDDKIWSNARFRICLRVQDRQDSMEMLHTGDAASITLSGRGYFQVGNNEIYDLFQSGWSGAPAVKELSGKGAAYPVRLDGRRDKRLDAGKKRQSREVKTSQLEAVSLQVSKAAREQSFRRGRALWMEPLPPLLDLTELMGDASPARRSLADSLDNPDQTEYQINTVQSSDRTDVNRVDPAPNNGREITGIIGLFDDPANQCQPLFNINLLYSGHILVCGISMSGKSSLIQTFLYSLCSCQTPDALQIYGIDWGGGILRAFEQMPHVGMTAVEGEEEKARRILKALDKRLADRKHIFQGGSYLRSGRDRSLPLLLLVVDNYPAFREETSGKYDTIFQRLAKEGEKMGLLLLVSGTGISSSELPFSLAAFFKSRICLEQKENYDYVQVLGSLHMPDIQAGGRPGKGIGWCQDKLLEFQSALCIPDQDDYSRTQWIQDAGKKLSRICKNRAMPVKIIPDRLDEKTVIEELVESPSDQPCIMAGFLDEDAEAFKVPLPEVYCLPIVTNETEYRESLSSLLLWSACARPDIDFIVIDQNGSFTADRTGITYLSEAEEIIEFFHRIIPLIQLRAGKLADEREEMQDDGRHLLIYITHMKNFLGMSSDERYNLTGFLNNIWSKGRGLGITFAASMDIGELTEMKLMEPFEIFCRQGSGMLIGGSLSSAGIFNSADLPLACQTKKLEKGMGYFFSEKGNAVLIRLPPLQR